MKHITLMLGSPPYGGQDVDTVKGHTVSLFLLQEAVRFCDPAIRCSNSIDLQKLIDRNLELHALTRDAQLRGIDVQAIGQPISGSSYESLIDLLESCERVVGIL